MRLRKSKLRHPGLPPDKVEALGLMTPEELAACHVKVSEIREPGTPPFGLQAPARAAADGKRSAAAAAGEPPLLIGGESLRRPHRGKGAGTPDFPGYSESVVLHNGKPVIVPGVRTVKGQKVGIDWVSCVFEAKEAWQYFFLSELQGEQPEKNDDARTAKYVRDVFSWILGFDREEGVTKVYANGLNGYKYAIGMPNGSGVVHTGHASATCLVTVSGQGALSAVPGWEHRLHRFLSDVQGWLTRIDMAYDDYQGHIFPVRVMREKAKEGAFNRSGRPPKIELRGAWEQDDPNNSGLTLYVGSRLSGKLARLYEKGKQLGDENSPWVRCEVELHNSCYQLTLDMLLNPSSWFVCMYPCFESIQYSGNRCELEYRERIATSTVEHSQKWIRHQCGGHIAALRQFYSDTELLDLLSRPDAIPESFRVANKALENLLAPVDSLTMEPGWIEA